MSMTGMHHLPYFLEYFLLTGVLYVYVCQCVFINLTPRYQLEPPCIARGSLIMSLKSQQITAW